jgi:hypothetical protein
LFPRIKDADVTRVLSTKYTLDLDQIFGVKPVDRKPNIYVENWQFIYG